MKTYGRKTIYANYTEQELLGMDPKTQYETIIEIIKNSLFIHKKNKFESMYLVDYWNGMQDIYIEKKKITRPEIDNRTVENWAYAFIDFKKCWLLGKPIQYTQTNDGSNAEISALNDYCHYENKKTKDMLLYGDVLVTGRGYRYTAPDNNGTEDEAPFELANIKSGECEIVYSSQLGHEQLFSYIETSMMYIDTSDENKKKTYSEYTVYLRNKKIIISGRSGTLQVIPQILNGIEVKEIPLIVGEHYIKEYYLNEDRISLIEIGKPLFNDINYLESLDKDDMEQYVNAIMVFTNVAINTDDLSEIRKLGALSLSSTNEKPGSVNLLEQRLNANTTQTYYSRLLNALHQILGIPKAGDSGEVSYGDTGQARLTGQGYTSAGIRATGDENMFLMCDLESLKTIIKICKLKNSEIKDLKVRDIEQHPQRDMQDNLLVKTEALMNLYNCKIPRKFANAIIGLFGDSNAVTVEQNRIYGEEGAIQESISNNTNDVK